MGYVASHQTGLVLTGATLPPPDPDFPIQYLGRWCLSTTGEDDFSYSFSAYHWDDREKLATDAALLQHISDETVKILGNTLNKLHGTTYSERYWKIILGSWALGFIPAVFDRFQCLKDFFDSSSDFTVVLSSQISNDTVPPNDTYEFNSKLDDHSWNERLFLDILHCSQFDFITQKCSSRFTPAPENSYYARTENRFVGNLKQFLLRTMKHNKYVFNAAYLPASLSRKLQLSLGQLPLVHPPIPLPQFTIDTTMRDRLKQELKIHIHELPGRFQPYLSILEEIIPSYIPKSYLEGFSDIRELWFEGPYPKSVKTVFTATGIHNDDLFKNWVAEQTEKGAKLLIGQHGGCYGSALFHSRELHEISICDVFVSWGWHKTGYENIKPLGNFVNHKKRLRANKNGKALIGLTAGREYAAYLESTPVSSVQWAAYQDFQFQFATTFPQEFQANIRVRPYPSKSQLRFREMWNSRFPTIELDDEGISFQQSLQNARIYVGTDNNTTWLHTLNSNFPTLVVTDDYFWEIRPEAESSFKLLEEVGIMHHNVQSASKHLQDWWPNLEAWWDSTEVTTARLKFISSFSAKNPTLFRDLRNEIRRK